MDVNKLIKQLEAVDDKTKEIIVLSYKNGVYSKEEIKNIIEDFDTKKDSTSNELKIVAIITNKEMDANKKVYLDLKN